MNFTDWISVAAPAAYFGWLVRDIAARREARRSDRSQTSARVDVQPDARPVAVSAPSVPVLMADPVLDELTS